MGNITPRDSIFFCFLQFAGKLLERVTFDMKHGKEKGTVKTSNSPNHQYVVSIIIL
jgi:hypothetical protein